MSASAAEHEALIHLHRIGSAADAFDPADPAQVRVLTAVLEETSSLLARDALARQNIGNATSPSIWPILRRLWVLVQEVHMLSEDDPTRLSLLAQLSLALAKFTRNLVAANKHNQANASENELLIRKLLYHYSSYSSIQDPTSYPLTRMLIQALSNMVTQNDSLTDSLWATHLCLPEQQFILTRLVASPDASTLSSTFVLVLNCIHENDIRMKLLIDGPQGPRLCITLLDRMASLFEAEESSEEGKVFDLGYEIFSRVIEAGLGAALYTKLSVAGEAIAPHQTTLLRLIDSYLHSSQDALAVSLAGQPQNHCLLDRLTDLFLDLASYAQTSIQRALGPCRAIPSTESPDGTGLGSTPRADTAEANMADQPDDDATPLQEFDLLLPKVCEALVLATQCLTTIALRAEESAAATGPTPPVPDGSDAGSRRPRTVMATAKSPDGQGFVECLVATLRLVDVFVPRITYGKIVQRPPAPGQREVQGATAMSGSRENERGDWGSDPRQMQSAQAFVHVKRDLVRLLGILASHDRAVQDRARECGGIPAVMNLCVVDDYNPYLREHAVFALRNLLFGNLENQAVVRSVQPVGRWDEDKVLQELRSGER